MANYCCSIRTNYFRVSDESAFLDLMDHVQCSEDTIEVFTEKRMGEIYYGFGCYGGISGVDETYYLRLQGIDPTDDSEYDEDVFMDTRYDLFIDRLKELVAEGDAIIIQESGNEKLRYLIGAAHIITKTNEEYLSISKIAAEKAAEMLKNPDWSTKMDY